MMSKPFILNIPPELLLTVLRYLGYRDILKCEAVCKYFNKAIKDSVEMQYLIELGADGMIDGARTPSSLPTAERLQLLLNRRARWRTLNWTKSTELNLDGLCHAYELVGGVFAKTMGSVPGARHLTTIDLPTRDTRARRTIREDMGVPSRDFAIDPSQDLLAIVEIDESINPESVSVHLRTISTNSPHKLAKFRTLQCQTLGRITSCFIQIVDDMIGLFFWLQNPALLIWNWRTGKLVLRCEADPADEGVVPQNHPTGFPQLPPATWDFGFLSNRTYLINSIHGKGFIHIYSFDGDAEPDVAPTLWATLAMPDIQPMRTVHHFATHSAPFLAGDITSGKPFTTDENARVYMMTITYGPQMRYHIFMKSEFLESLIPKQEQLVSGQTYVPPIYQWEKWGPANTRFIENHVHYQWLRYVQGHRVVLPPLPVNPLAWPSSLYRICVLDFNVHPKRVTDPCDPYRKRSKETTYTIHNKEHAVAAKQLFTKDVMTRLPYAISTRIGVFNYSGFMIDEERLIGMKSSASSSDGDLSSIHVFTL